MSEDRKKLSIEIGADPSSAVDGFGKVAQSAKTMKTSLDATLASSGKTIEGLGASATKSADGLSRAERSMVQSIQRTTAAFSAGSKSSSEYYNALATQRGIDPAVLAPYLAALDKVAPKQKAVSDAVAATVPVMQKYEQSAKATAAALRQVPAQFTDIVVGLQGGQNPLTVLLQQGGQLKDVFGGVGNAARAMGGYILGLVSPLSVAAVTAGTLGYAFYAGRKEAEEFNKSLILTGNFAGTTSGALANMADNLDNLSGVTKGSAAEALAALAATGQIGAAQLERFAGVALAAEREVGTAVKDTAAQFIALGKDPVAASTKLNESMHYLTMEVYSQIKALDDQGKSAAAAALAQQAYADALDSRTKSLAENLGILEKTWRGVSTAAREAWDWMLNVGREDTTEQQIKKLEQRLSNAAALADKARARGQIIPVSPAESADKVALENLRETARLKERAAQATAQEARDVETRVKFDKLSSGGADKASKMKKELLALENEYGDAVKRGIVTQKEYDSKQAEIRNKYADKGAVTKSGELDKARAAFDVEKIQQAMEAQTNAYANGEKRLEAARSAGLLSDAEYYSAKQAYIESNTIAQVIALDAEIAREKQRKAIGNTATERALSEIDRDKKVLELTGKRTKILADAGTASDVLASQETASAKKIADGYNEATFAAQNYLDTVQRGYARELAGAGRGDQFRSRAAGRAQIEDRFESQRNAALSQFRTSGGNSDDKQRYDRRLAELKEFQQKELEAYDQGIAKKIASDANWENGATRAMENYVDASTNAAEQTSEVFANAFKGVEDALVSFTQTGKLSFTDMADSIVNDITRIIIKQQLANLLTKSTGGSDSDGVGSFIASLLGSAPGKAVGGPVSAGGLYQVNERGPELLSVAGKDYLMMGGQGGSVTPNGGSASGGVNVINNFTINGPTDRRSQEQIAAQVGMATQRAMARNS